MRKIAQILAGHIIRLFVPRSVLIMTWFYRQLSQPTTDDIEMRLCGTDRSYHEDIALEIVNLFIQ